MTQLENEYGSYQRKDRKYMEWLKAFWSRKGFGPFYTSDGAGEHFLKGVVLPGVAVGLDPGLNDGHWAVANKCNPGVPVFPRKRIRAGCGTGGEVGSHPWSGQPRPLVYGQGAFLQLVRFPRRHQFRILGRSQQRRAGKIPAGPDEL